MFVLSVGYAQQVEYTNQVTVKWNAVIPIEPTDIISYQLWTDNDGALLDGETDLLVYTFTFSTEGEYILGVSTTRIVATTGDIVYSEINWSDVDIPIGATPDSFLIRYIKPILSPGNLRLK